MLKKCLKSFQVGHRPVGTSDYLHIAWLVRLYQNNEINKEGKIIRPYKENEILSKESAIEEIAKRWFPEKDEANVKRHIKRHLVRAEAFMKKLGISYEKPECMK